MVRGGDDDAVFIGQLGIEGILDVEHPAPHRRPEIVALHAQDQFEDVLVHAGIETAEFGKSPAREGGGFVVDEDAAVFDFGLAQGVAAGRDIEFLLLRGRDVAPEMPGRNPDLAGEIEQAVDGAAFIAAGDDEGARDPWQGIFNDLGGKTFPSARQARRVQLSFGGQPVDQGADAERSDEDDITGRRRRIE